MYNSYISKLYRLLLYHLLLLYILFIHEISRLLYGFVIVCSVHISKISHLTFAPFVMDDLITYTTHISFLKNFASTVVLIKNITYTSISRLLYDAWNTKIQYQEVLGKVVQYSNQREWQHCFSMLKDICFIA